MQIGNIPGGRICITPIVKRIAKKNFERVS